MFKFYVWFEKAGDNGVIGGQMTNVAAAKAGYIEVYSQVGFIAIGISVLMLLISPVITKMMHGAD